MFFKVTTLAAMTAALAGFTTAAAVDYYPPGTTAAAAANGHTPARRDIDVTASTSGKCTWYDPGLGACGYTNTDADLVVALSHADFDPSTPNGNPNNNPLCGKKLKAAYNGLTATVTVVDRCVACNSGDLDLSPSAFGVLAATSVGVIYGTWAWA